MRQSWTAVDLDGTLAEYHGWQGDLIGDPIDPMLQRVRKMIRDGKDVRIFTARMYHDDDGRHRKAIEAWCFEHTGKVLPITNCKDYGMLELYDDRAIQVIPNIGIPIQEAIDPVKLAEVIASYKIKGV